MLYDMIVVGSGCAGLAGAMYAGRLGLSVLVLGQMRGGTIINTNLVENYPGFISISGIELASRLEQHAKAYPSVQIKDEKVNRIERNGDGFAVFSDAGAYQSRTILYAAGTEWKKLGVPGEEAFASRGVHYCALCDAAFYKGKTAAVIGGSDSAAKDALVLAEWAQKVFIIYRGEKIRPEPTNYQRVVANPKIEIIPKANVLEIKGDKKVSGVVLDRSYNGSAFLPLDGVFVAIGHVPLSQLAKEAGVEVDERGYVRINRNSETNVPGFFAAGDVTDTRFKQAIVGVGEAVEAAYSAYLYLGGGKK
ncbi:MAG: FAD-dependent oxidoreductase [Candidatus Micrarchaeota archaeon]|nr:FAD-dependent oxidoreductase [Candidatus Micrarchaeota archaeon]